MRVRDMSSVSRSFRFRSWPCSCPMLLQISLHWIHTRRTPGPRHGEHGITESPQGWHAKTLTGRANNIATWGSHEGDMLVDATARSVLNPRSMCVVLLLTRRALAVFSVAKSATRARHAESRPAATVASP